VGESGGKRGERNGARGGRAGAGTWGGGIQRERIHVEIQGRNPIGWKGTKGSSHKGGSVPVPRMRSTPHVVHPQAATDTCEDSGIRWTAGWLPAPPSLDLAFCEGNTGRDPEDEHHPSRWIDPCRVHGRV